MALSKSLRKFIKSEMLVRENFSVVDEHLSAAELAFVDRARKKHLAIVHRPSWPDFLLRINGELVGVEVKSKKDRISANQRRTFNLLTEAGILKIFVWNSETPDRLITWSNYIGRFKK